MYAWNIAKKLLFAIKQFLSYCGIHGYVVL